MALLGLNCRLVCGRVVLRTFNHTRIINKLYITCLKQSSTYTIENNPHSYCVNLVRKYDHENYLSILLLPKSLRRAAFAIRAFNIEISQIKDMVSTHAIGEMRIQFWKNALERIYKDQPPEQPVALELARVVSSLELSKHWFKRLIDCRSARLIDQPFNSLQELESYSENSVSSIYYLLLEVLGVKNIHADHAASHIGKAQGVTNFIRAIPYHLKNGKVLIPNDIMIKHNLSHEQILRGSGGQLLENMVFDIASVAHQHVKMARSLKKNVPDLTYVLFLPLVSTDKYLIALEKSDFNPFHSQLQVRNTWLPCTLLWSKIRKRY
ncbi:NADH dehydrogenase (ubiquinone) complex I, assembly factor 6 [Chamberlinius hualienensis]